MLEADALAQIPFSTLKVIENTGRGGGIRTPDPLLPKQILPFVEPC
jgi:hypothetical protein